MKEFELFLGFAVDERLDRSLAKIPQGKRSCFIGEGDASLHEVRHQGERYLGRRLGAEPEVSSLPLVEANISSIIRKLVDDYSLERPQFALFAIEKAKK